MRFGDIGSSICRRDPHRRLRSIGGLFNGAGSTNCKQQQVLVEIPQYVITNRTLLECRFTGKYYTIEFHNLYFNYQKMTQPRVQVKLRSLELHKSFLWVCLHNENPHWAHFYLQNLFPLQAKNQSMDYHRPNVFIALLMYIVHKVNVFSPLLTNQW